MARARKQSRFQPVPQKGSRPKSELARIFAKAKLMFLRWRPLEQKKCFHNRVILIRLCLTQPLLIAAIRRPLVCRRIQPPARTAWRWKTDYADRGQPVLNQNPG